MDKIKQSLYNSRITIMLLCVFVGTKLPMAILSYFHYFHMASDIFFKLCQYVKLKLKVNQLILNRLNCVQYPN